MPTPFPGMDPYLEQPELWPDVHNSLIAALRNDLAPKLRPRYYLAIEERLYLAETGSSALVGRADVAVIGQPQPVLSAAQAATAKTGVISIELPIPDQVRETFLEVREISNRVVTTIEILSPSNKCPGPGRNLYLQKRLSLLGSQTHLIEIDLLRAWEAMPMVGPLRQSHYRILISRAEQRPRADLLPFNLRQPISGFSLPLQPGDVEPEVAIGQLLHQLYDQAGYDLRLDYRAAPSPPLTADDLEWIEQLLRQSTLH